MNPRRQAARQVAFATLLIVVVLSAFVTSRGWPFGARLFPFWVSGATVLLLVLILLRQLPGLWAPELDLPEGDGDLSPLVARREARLVMRTGVVIAAFAVLLYLLGFLIGGPLAVLIYVRYVGGERWLSAALLAASAAVAVLLFQKVLRVPFPEPVVPILGFVGPISG